MHKNGIDNLCWSLAIAGGVIAGTTDFVARIHLGEDLWPAMPLGFFGGLILTLLQPRRPWRWVLAGAFAVLATHLIGTALTGHRPLDPPASSVLAPLVIIVPAAIGSLVGTILLRISAALTP